MIKSICRLPWTYIPRPTLRVTPLKSLAVVVKTATDYKRPFSLRNYGTSHEDQTLRQIFDSEPFWQDFSRQSVSDLSKSRTGLFQNRYLTEPPGFLRFAQDIQKRCQKLVDDVLRASSTEEYKAIPRHLDLLSDSLCRVLDISDFVRATHPDARFQQAATQAYALLWEYMNVLNTTPGLNRQLQKAVASSEISSSWNEEEATVARILLKDFSNSAIDLPSGKRQLFVDLSNDVKSLGNEFLENMAPAKPYAHFDTSQMKGMDPRRLGHYTTRRNKVAIPVVGEDAYIALSSVQDEDIRRHIYTAGRQASKTQILTLEKLMETRAGIAKLSNFGSYADMSLADKMAKSPEAVNSFLTALSADNAPHVKRELDEMVELKRKTGSTSEINPWDIIYYRQFLNAQLRSNSRKPDFMSAYFSLGTVMQGLSRLFTRLYGISFVPHKSPSGEIWTPDVRRLDVIHEDEGHVAVLYCDLFARAGKSPNPAHFTLRCSRLVSPAEDIEGSDDSYGANDGMATARSSATGDLYQLPTIALICDFPHPPNSTTPTLLAFRDVQTLFHEMGHAIHSILGRTSLQVVSGTRCPTDFAELPSVLMESFASDPSVLALFARHWETDAPLPFAMVEEAMDLQKRWQGLQTETQILYSLLDQAYHSSLPLNRTGPFDSTKTFFDVYDKYGSVREPRETSAQGFFGHLVEYGGTYYSYLFDRAIAGKVWKEVFRSGKDGGGVDREAGEKYKDEVLRWGGSRSAWACVSGVLGDERLKEGGKEAMEEVGRWGVRD